MDFDSFNDQFAELALERLTSEAARKYTVVVDGKPVNMGFYRDTLWDVLEELADAVNIADIAFQRVYREITYDRYELFGRLIGLRQSLMYCAQTAAEIRSELPEDMRRDQTEILGPVRRIVAPWPDS